MRYHGLTKVNGMPLEVAIHNYANTDRIAKVSLKCRGVLTVQSGTALLLRIYVNAKKNIGKNHKL